MLQHFVVYFYTLIYDCMHLGILLTRDPQTLIRRHNFSDGTRILQMKQGSKKDRDNIAVIEQTLNWMLDNHTPVLITHINNKNTTSQVNIESKREYEYLLKFIDDTVFECKQTKQTLERMDNVLFSIFKRAIFDKYSTMIDMFMKNGWIVDILSLSFGNNDENAMETYLYI